MLESLSPYQILKACSVTAQERAHHAAPEYTHTTSPALNPAAPSSIHQAQDVMPPPMLHRRTHYITDIHNRHTAAQRYLPG